jgi:hypothetical protein
MRAALRLIFVVAVVACVGGVTLALARTGADRVLPAIVGGFSLVIVLGLLVAWLLEDAIRENREILESLRDWPPKR